MKYWLVWMRKKQLFIVYSSICNFLVLLVGNFNRSPKCLRLVDEMASFGVRSLIFSGGEPLLRDDLFTIAEFAHECALNLQIATNATLIDDKTARKLKKLDFTAQVSLDGATPKVHER